MLGGILSADTIGVILLPLVVVQQKNTLQGIPLYSHTNSRVLSALVSLTQTSYAFR